MRSFLNICLLTTATAISSAAADPARLAQLIDYVGVDYAVAVENGEIISPAEYGEMQEFSGVIMAEIEALESPDTQVALRPLAQELASAIDAKAAPADIAAITTRMREILLQSGFLNPVPQRIPQLAQAEKLYAEYCSSCHGADGRGDGPAAKGLEPAPTDFTDAERARQRTLYGLYNTISLGVEGTSMPSFAQLSASERWALAFYAGSLHASGDTMAEGKNAFAALPASAKPGLSALTMHSLNDVAREQGAFIAAAHVWLRAHPEALAKSRPDPIAVAIAGVEESLSLYQAGRTEDAYQTAVEAYLEGFELAEAALRATNPDLVVETEIAMTELRQRIKYRASAEEVAQAAAQAIRLLQSAQRSLTEEKLSSSVAFTSAFVILAREGLEAVLILGAIAAFLSKTGRRDAMPWLHAGWIAALGLGVLTWMVSNYVVTISGATREITEGITALVATGVLFYVGFWMHSKLSAQRWQLFIQTQVRSALDQRTLFGIAFIAFIAVYREVFETVLFYQALWVQVEPADHAMIFGGFGAGAAFVLGVAWGIFRFGLRLPLKQFFGVSAAVMISLAIIFAGKGIAALQEAGKLPLSPVNFPRIELLGIYPNLQSLGLQLALIATAAALIIYNARSSRAVHQ